MIPASVREAVVPGHEVPVQTGAAEHQGIPDEDYLKAGAKIAKLAEDVFPKADLVVKVKEPHAAARSSSPCSTSPLGIVQAPTSLRRQNGPARMRQQDL